MMDDAQAYELASAAQRAWLCQGAPLQLVWRSENIVFATLHGSGAKLALRLHRPGYQDPAAIACELAWCAQLADAGVAVVEPLPAASGAWIAQVQGMTASCLRWISGKPFGEAGVPLADSAVLKRAGELGALLADLHNASDAGACPAPFARASWDREALIGPAPRLGPFWENPTLAPEESLLLQQAREKAALLLPQATDYGPIHGDVLRSNVMVEAGALRLIDFDDCGPGWRLYDLATALIQSWGDPDLPEQARRLVQGYRTRRALPDDQLALLPLFLALRGFASAGWVVSRAPQDLPRQRAYAQRALDLAQLLLADTPPWEDIG
ncbi:hypothetical protein CKO11_14660 [Rhodobacter sp. TJ_12]|uniref:phosphotransferase enzyme family protein n=1 Tax=Rhodobacter sp. TJ_12 TaxID=2029399 RepID=UPI001CBF2645|nr:phosphotransferase [Rhodobacter sp. TJ_12]MBZ4023692.1 hypothetical protein [Rhodobacter sp. TJ_12]